MFLVPWDLKLVENPIPRSSPLEGFPLVSMTLQRDSPNPDDWMFHIGGCQTSAVWSRLQGSWHLCGQNMTMFTCSNDRFFKKKKINCLPLMFSSVAQWCPTLCDPMNQSTPGLPVHHQLPEFTQTHVHWVGDAIQPSHPLSSPPPPAPNPSQHQGLFQWVNSSHEVAKVLDFQLRHQSFQWTPRTDLL